MQNDMRLQIINKLNDLAHIRKQLQQLKSSKLALIDPNSGQGKVLAILKEQPAISQKELVTQLAMKPQSASEIIRKLEKKDYLTRQPDEKDKRSLTIQLTDAGQQAVTRLSLSEVDHIDALTQAQQQQLDYMLDQLIASFSEENTTAKQNFGTNLFGAATRK
ncbi:MarR family winged helix-turn-helix transcriptional regulator [Furfurilactobacillus siliginis]|uniref:HTH marR-type domain-containing protein n=1 Tax=Furfurilactobacillus siliginis TaxID=348151 RepID=A0A0R2LBI1_9LACO|nr:MarR family transcriptional regulator [Furfurilactobacillus siliginis]KRN96055.1 hypothetical protein IV55_GL001738 [Furfurilactobacillus siliginis]GEK28761.1 hypothetical protein LSI01_10720 [Furfurilactobacillus siliginis]